MTNLSSHSLPLVNGDDFGRSTSVNTAIVRAFEAGLISSCTIMATGSAFEQACALAEEERLSGHIGLHFVLDEGEPLTEALRCQSRFCHTNGRLRLRTPGQL